MIAFRNVELRRETGQCIMFKTFASAVCVAVLFGLAQPACAWDATSTASISNITFQLIDLAPNDGYAPAITFPDGLAWEINSHAINTQSSDAQHFVQNGGFAASTATSLLANTSNATGSAWESGIPFGGAGLIATSAGADRYGHGQGTARTFINFLLSPHTQLVVTGDVAMSGSTTGVGEIAAPGFEFSGSVLIYDAWQPTGWMYNMTVRSDEGEQPPQPHTQSFSQSYQFTLTNEVGYTIPGYISATVTSNVTSNLADQVPEPAAWALLAAGLAGIAFKRRLQLKAWR